LKLIIAGCRDADIHNDPIAEWEGHKGNIGCIIYHVLGDKVQTVEEVVHGDSGIADKSGALWGMLFDKIITPFPADWDLHGKAAGPIRNREMAEYADELLALWDGKSRGTKNMIEEMIKAGKPVHIYPIKRYRP
jgi:hypothetical protein